MNNKQQQLEGLNKFSLLSTDSKIHVKTTYLYKVPSAFRVFFSSSRAANAVSKKEQIGDDTMYKMNLYGTNTENLFTSQMLWPKRKRKIDEAVWIQVLTGNTVLFSWASHFSPQQCLYLSKSTETVVLRQPDKSQAVMDWKSILEKYRYPAQVIEYSS